MFRKFKPEETRQSVVRAPETPAAKPEEEVSEKPAETKPVAPSFEPETSPVAAAVPETTISLREVKADTPVSIPKTPGKGGPKHKHLQRIIKQWAQGMDYMVRTEEEITGGQVDVSLEKPNRKIACEISLTTASKHETGNIKKCLAASFDFVVLVVPEEKRIAGFIKAIQPILSEAEFSKVRIVTPDGLFSFIEELDLNDVTTFETVKGYKVKVTHKAVDEETKKQRQAMLSKIVADSLKRKKKE